MDLGKLEEAPRELPTQFLVPKVSQFALRKTLLLFVISMHFISFLIISVSRSLELHRVAIMSSHLCCRVPAKD